VAKTTVPFGVKEDELVLLFILLGIEVELGLSPLDSLLELISVEEDMV